MLSEICIRDFTILDKIQLEFNHGMHVITGETGAGKSIMIDAVELALGQRATNNIVRNDSEKTDITVTFDINNIESAKKYLNLHDLSPDECVIRRVIYQDGRSKSYLNGTPTTLQTLRELSEHLIDIHGQHEFQTLLQSSKQRQLLDDFAKNNELVHAVETLYQEWRSVKNEFDSFNERNQNATQRIDFLTYQVQELDTLNLTAEEIENIDKEHKQLSHTDDILENTREALNAINIDDGDSASTLLARAQQAIQRIADIDPKLETANELLNQAIIYTDEAQDEIQHFLEQVNLDPERLAYIEQQLTKIYDLARKHHVKPQALSELHQQLKAELDQLENKDELLQELQMAMQHIEKDYRDCAKKLTNSRKKAAKKLSVLVTDNMQQLGMPGGKFDIHFETLEQLSSNGLEKVIFMVSANPGHPFQPLNKVASGGELSRISLAIQVITAQFSDTPSLIFDEIDVGIGGATAEIVGNLLRELGQKTQVLCITHLAQVAAKANHHFQVTKSTANDSTNVSIQKLSPKERIQEIARMSGGVKITPQTLAHAEEMLEG